MKRIVLILCLAAALMAGTAVSAQAITKPAAKHLTNGYAKAQCAKDDKCKRYGASFCHSARRGVGCYAYNFQLSAAHGKYTCRKFIFWFNSTHYHAAQWKCKISGWHFS